jgi:sarcosine oxidase
MKIGVVGAGVVGCATARALARSGHDVTLYEQFDLGHNRGSSHGESRIYRYSYPDERYVAMMIEAMPLWRELEAECGEQLLLRTEGLDTGKPVHDHAAALETHGIAFEILDGAEVRKRWPMLRLDGGDVLYQKDGGIVRAEPAWRALAAGAVAAGTHLVRARVEALKSDSDAAVVTSGGEERFDSVVVTAGGWARDLLMTCGIDIPTRTTRETIAFFDIDRAPPTLVDWAEPTAYALPNPSRGLKAGEHIAGPIADPDEAGGPNESAIERLKEWVAERYPTATPEPWHTESCLYTNTEDEHFILERHGNIVVGSPCSGHGFKFAPLNGKRLAALATG